VARIDYIEDPNAPKANSVVPSVVAVVEDDQGRILLIHKTDNDLWALPGGGHDIGESIGDTVVREVREDRVRRRGHRHRRHVHQPAARHGLRRRRGTSTVFDLLHGATTRRRAEDQQRKQGSSLD
jgi:ADP-ribose pyrophosphatase YjhB (NUDIX family)